MDFLTLKELKEIVDRYAESDPRWEDKRVCIPNNKGGMGGTPVTDIVSAGCGIDWDSSKFFLFPKVKMGEIENIK